jgi:hypothetical protein
MKETALMPRLDVLYPSKVTCNKCATVIWTAETAERDNYGLPVAWDTSYFEVSHTWGYGSPKDGTKHEWDLCEPCYVELVKSFKVPINATSETV